MHYKNYINEIIEAFDECVKQYSQAYHGLSCHYQTLHHKRDIKARLGTVEFNGYKIIFKFTVHNLFSQVNHILEAHIAFNNEYSYPIHHVIGYYHIEASEIFVFPCVCNPITMKDCMQLLTHNIEKYLPDILQYNPVYLANDYKNDVLSFFKANDDDYSEFFHDSFIETVQIAELDKAYFEYLMMNYDSSLNLYKKKKRLTFYETVINNIMKRNIKHEEMPYSLQYHLGFYNKQTIVKTDIKEIISLLISIVILTIGWGIFFYIFHKGLMKLLIPYDLYIQLEFFYMFIVFFVLGILSAYYKRKFFYNLFYKKDYNNYLERDYLQNSVNANRLMNALTHICVIFALFITVFFTNTYIAFGNDGIINNLSFLQIHGDYYTYEEIYIEHYQDQLNGYNELLGEETYVIKGNDLKIDLYEYMDISKAKESIIPHLISKDVEIKELDICPYE